MPRFRLLGPLEVATGNEWQKISSPKWRSILAALLVNAGQVVSAEALAEEVWEYEDRPARALNTVSIYVLRLRRLMGDPGGALLATRPPGYQLRVGPADTDAQRFETLVRDCRRSLGGNDPHGAARQAREALALWRGCPLADVPRSSLIKAEAAKLTELRIYATELRITAELACSELRPAETVHELRRLLADNPLREGLWLLLMQALDRAGRHAEALEAYGQARAVISGELGVDPGSELREFHARLLAADSADARQIFPGPAAHVPEPAHGKTGEPAQDHRASQMCPPPEPGNVTSREDFGRELTAATARAGLTAKEIARTTGNMTSQVRAYLTGHDLPPRTQTGLKTLRVILAGCGITAAEDVLAWTDALIRAWPEPDPSPLAAPGRTQAVQPAQHMPAPAVPDAPGFGLCPDPLTAQTTADFIETLAQYRIWAGEPSFREMERACGRKVSAASMCTALRNSKLPSQRVVRAIVQACGGTARHQENFVTAWRMLRTPRRGAKPANPPGRRTLYPVPDTA